MTTVFCGNGALLAQCLDVFVGKGGRIAGVISTCPDVLNLADARGYPVLGTPDAPELEGTSFDWLLSIANPAVLHGDVLKMAGQGAINVHDGKLPEQAGLNAPTWSLLSGAKTHEVNWHLMTERVNAGPIVLSEQIEIAEDETVFSLNARCFDAALNSFATLCDALLAGNVASTAQSGPRTWSDRADRPPLLGCLHAKMTASEAVAMVRALDFGSVRNPLGFAKLWTGKDIVQVQRALRVDAIGSVGSIARVDADGVTLVLQDGAVQLSGFVGMRGAVLTSEDLGLSAGETLPQIPDLDPREIGRDEPVWLERLNAAQPAIPPYPQRHAPSDRAIVVPLHAKPTQAQLAAAFASWVASMTGTDATFAVRSNHAHVALSALRPVTVAADAADTAEALTDAVDGLIAEAMDLAPMALDLAHRSDNPEKAVQALSVQIAGQSPDTHSLEDADIVVVAQPAQFIMREGVFAEGAPEAIGAAFSAYLSAFLSGGELANLPLGSAADLSHPGADVPQLRLHELFAEQVTRTPDAIALEADGQAMTFAQLDDAASGLAVALATRGAAPGTIVGLCVERSADLIVSIFAILKTGAAYLPLDPSYPGERIHYMIEDSHAPLIVASDGAAARHALDPAKTISPTERADGELSEAGSFDDLACLIYTSGSTGKPKGVMVPHRSLGNFMVAMDEVVPRKDGDKLLAVTSVCFDISALEIFWTLTRGMTVCVQTDGAGESDIPGFSLFYFASEASGSGHHAYRLLIEGAKFADENGFEAIWNPERHFHAFGGLYPNPAVSLAAVAGMTKNVKLRAGSFVAPLHHPVRAAEDWSLVDNLSNGRVGVAFASGWQPNDFVTRPENFTDRKAKMIENIGLMRSMWRGEKQVLPGHDGKDVEFEIHPRPVQEDIPLWITAAGNPETFADAARLGCNVLTHLLGQSFEEVAEKLKAYRMGWREAGHPGTGKVTMMLHTFVSDDENMVRETARGPMKSYLKSSVDLLKKASWSTPLIVERSNNKGMTPAEMFEKKDLSDEETEALLDHAFERYYQTSGLFGTPESAQQMVRELAAIGVDEIACLIDFGIDTDLVLENLPNIKKLMTALEEEGGVGRKASIAEEIIENDVTHFQCTPPMATFLAADEVGAKALSQLDVMMVGGEAFPPDLAERLRTSMTGKLMNMYGPTETTVWSSVQPIETVDGPIDLGTPVANTVISIRSPSGRALPPMVEGELWIGGKGVTDGYWERPELNAERFVDTPEGTFYRTGDLARRRADNTLEFLGRMDSQVKVRGYRIELGEIEARLADVEGVRQAVVSAVEFGAGDTRLVGYVSGTVSDQSKVLAKMAERLPEFMVPSQIVNIDAMPLTPNGKIDRKALPHPRSTVQTEAAVAVEGEVEEKIAEIWCDALGLDTVSSTANFFDLGGHSLLVVQVQRRIKEALQRNVAITDVFRYTTIRSLASHLAGDDGTKGQKAVSRGAARAEARKQRRNR